ncbi:MAG: pitrilysin family protein, partial [Terriglobales bacterium]
MVADIRNVKKKVLPNGLTILTEDMQHIRSVSIGIWLKTGSRDEDSAVNGISHFVEHMVFKGTKNRTALDIARQMDSIGGNMDAFTGKETICFNAKVLDEHLPIAMDVLSDLVLNPTFAAKDINREKGVILEEIKMDEDNPDYLVHEIFTQNFWKGHALGKPILGTKETVRELNQDAVLAFYRKRFAPNNLVISAAGSLDHKRFVDLVSERFRDLQPEKNGFHGDAPQVFAKLVTRNKKALEQVQICMGAPSPHISHAKRYVSYILNTLLGGGMSSRLFQKIREEQGLVYSIYSDLNPYRDTGSLCVYAGTSKESAPKVVAEIATEFRRLKDERVSDDE